MSAGMAGRAPARWYVEARSVKARRRPCHPLTGSNAADGKKGQSHRGVRVARRLLHSGWAARPAFPFPRGEPPMKRVATLVLAAAAALGTAGCGPACDSGTTLVSWTGFDGPDATVNAPCGVAGVASVDIFLDNQYVGNWPCTDYGAAIPGVPTGGNILDVEGLADGPGSQILFRDELSYGQTGCGNTALQAMPGAGMVELDYSFAPTNACSAPPTYMWLAVDDDITGQPAFTETGMTAAQACSVTAPAPRYSLPNGAFTLVGMEEVAPGPAVVGADCTDRPFTIASGQVTTVSPVLVDSSRACF